MNQNKFLLINNEIKGIDWVPRAVLIFLGISFTIASFDVFGEGYNEIETIFALFIHLIPAIIVFGVLYLTWRRDFIGGVIFLGLSLLTLLTFEQDAYLLTSLPIFLVSVFYFISWWKLFKASDETLI